MTLYGRSQVPGAVQDETEHIQVAYYDNLQQLTHVDKSVKLHRPGAVQQPLAVVSSAAGGIRTASNLLTDWAEEAAASSPSAEAAHAVTGQEVWSDLQHLTQALLGNDQQAVVGEARLHQHQVQQRNGAGSTAAVLDNNRQMLAGMLQEQQQQKEEEEVAACTPLVNPWGSRQQQPQHHLQQTASKTPASMTQLLGMSSQQPAPMKLQQQKQQQGRRKSTLNSSFTTPQQQLAPKKKAKFTIREAPTAPASAGVSQQLGPAVAGRPNRAAPAAGGNAGLDAGGSNPLAALLGGAVTPARGQRGQHTAAGAPAAHDMTSSRTPHSCSRPGLAPQVATPRFSSTKGSRLDATAPSTAAAAQGGATPLGRGAGVAGAASAAYSCAGSSGKAAMDVHDAAAAGDAHEDDLTAHVVPAALFSDDAEAAAAAAGGPGPHCMETEQVPGEQRRQQQQQYLPGSHRKPAGISHSSVITAGAGGGAAAGMVSSATSNPLALMTEQRRRQQQFLQAIPAAARPAGSSLAGALAQAGGRSVPVPAGSSLAKVMQQVLAAQKEQQEQLAEALAIAAKLGGGTGNAEVQPGVLGLEIVSKSWEAHMVKCLCKVTHNQQQEQQQQQQQSCAPGQQVFLFVQSKAAHAVDSSPGSRVRLHAPWYELVQQQAGQPPVLLAHLLSAPH